MERRWQAHNIAKIKTIPCIVKEYESDTQFMIVSLIENIQREDLTDVEKAKFLRNIMVEQKLKNTTELAERVKISRRNIDVWFDIQKIRKDLVGPAKKVSQSVIRENSRIANRTKKRTY